MRRFAIGAVVVAVMLARGEWAGGAIGMAGIPRLSIGGQEIKDDLANAYLRWAVLGLAVLVTTSVITSRAGRGLRALATSETATAASGVPSVAYPSYPGYAVYALVLILVVLFLPRGIVPAAHDLRSRLSLRLGSSS